MFRYRLHLEDGSDEATYAQMIHPGDEIIAGKNERFRVVDVVTLKRRTSRPLWDCCKCGSASSERGPVLGQ
jgi:hypothetical protein